MKKTTILVFITLLVTFPLAACGGDQAQSESFKVGILQLTERLIEVENGFKAGMEEMGYTEGKNIVYVRKNANGNIW